MSAPVLSPADLESSTWLKLRAYLERELAERRAFNDGHTLDAVATARVRGDIDRIKKLLNTDPKAPD